MFFDTGLLKRKVFKNQLRPNVHILNLIEHRTQHTDLNLLKLSTKQSAYYHIKRETIKFIELAQLVFL